MALVTLLGEKLRTKSGEVSTAEALKGKQAVALYFSAHWCPPCRGFTPKLAEAYMGLVAAGKSFEIVFVSSDREVSAFDEYFAEQPWLALPYGERKLKAALSKRYKVSGIPALIILDGETGELITKDGRRALTDDVKQAIRWSAAIENAGQFTALRHAVVSGKGGGATAGTLPRT